MCARNMDFLIQGYVILRWNREEGSGGECATFVRQDTYRILGFGVQTEYIRVEVWCKGKQMVEINF